jgi:hypothetical protein
MSCVTHVVVIHHRVLQEVHDTNDDFVDDRKPPGVDGSGLYFGFEVRLMPEFSNVPFLYGSMGGTHCTITHQGRRYDRWGDRVDSDGGRAKIVCSGRADTEHTGWSSSVPVIFTRHNARKGGMDPLLLGPYVRHLPGAGRATIDAIFTMQPRSSFTRGAKGPSSGY